MNYFIVFLWLKIEEERKDGSRVTLYLNIVEVFFQRACLVFCFVWLSYCVEYLRVKRLAELNYS